MTDVSRLPLAEIERRMIARITAASDGGVLGYRLRQVASYGDEFDDKVQQTIKAFPAVWVHFAGADRPVTRGKSFVDWPLRFALIAAAQSHANEESGRHGRAREPGSYQIVGDMIALLIGQTLGLEISRIEASGLRHFRSDATKSRRYSIQVMELRTTATSESLPLAHEITDFAHFRAAWDLPPFIEDPAVPLPADAAAAIDDVTLETSHDDPAR